MESSAETKDFVPTGGGGATEQFDFKEKLDNQDIRINALVSKLETLEATGNSTIQQVKDSLNIIFTIVVGVMVVFVITIVIIGIDYLHNNDESRKYFSEILKDYETKQEAADGLNFLKDCIKTYGLSFCTSRK